ncbi:MAG: hypothetical protein CBD26_03835 [Candidatus Pelagibacter sp. TMED166]|nr:MAG: hypothetical protein CBD26_03835 [Candidatus Pelagibacter sp. TMED166]|tara:strand:- start:4351 stop:4692 length:342 start_codon:yes stop_codon:yes gene_type:complete
MSKKKNIGRNHYQSISKKLFSENKINKEFEARLNLLTLEELISLKLENSAKLVNGKLFGFPIWKTSNLIFKDSLIKFALSATKSHKEAANLLGLTLQELKIFIRKYKVNEQLE